MCAGRHLHSIISVFGFLSLGCLDHWVSSIRYGKMILVVHEPMYVCVLIQVYVYIHINKQVSKYIHIYIRASVPLFLYTCI